MAGKIDAPAQSRTRGDGLRVRNETAEAAATAGAAAGAAGLSRPRAVVLDSWQRSLAARIGPESALPEQVLDADRLAAARERNLLAGVLPVLRHTLHRTAEQCDHLMVVCDADGALLWREGSAAVRLDADRVHLAEGTRWSESQVGTNGIGTALALGDTAYVYATEHLVRSLHAWSCAATPIHDPDSGRLLGVVDLSSIAREFDPAVVELVNAAARLAEGELRAAMAARDQRQIVRQAGLLSGTGGERRALLSATGRVLACEPDGWLAGRVVLDAHPTNTVINLPDGSAGLLETASPGYLLRIPRTVRTHTITAHGARVLDTGGRSAGERAAGTAPTTLRLLGDRPMAVTEAGTVPLSLRHAEILALLVMHPAGLTAERLTFLLYGDDGNPVTVRAELHRLRGRLGAELIAQRPYRLVGPVAVDFRTVRQDLVAGAARRAIRSYPGPLLPESESITIRDARDELAGMLRRGVLALTDVDALWAYAQTGCGRDDLEVLTRLTELLPESDPRRAAASMRRRRLLADLGDTAAPGGTPY